jgi:hypothetical protein
MFAFLRRFALLLSSLLLISGATSEATDGIYPKFHLDLGYAGRTARWAIFSFGSGTAGSHFTAVDISSPSGNASPSQLTDNIAVAGDYADLSLSGGASLTGDIYLKPTGHVQEDRRSTWVGNANTSSSSSLNSGINSLKQVSTTAAGFNPTVGTPSTLNSTGETHWVFNLGMTGTNMTTGSSRVYYVPSNSIGKLTLRLTDFVLTKKSQVTFNGLAGQSAVIDVSNNFNVGGASKVLLTGGLTPSDILFNITGNNIGKPGALPNEIGGDSIFNGTLLAYNANGPQRSLFVSGHHTEFNGELIANRVSVTGGKVKKPKKASE